MGYSELVGYLIQQAEAKRSEILSRAFDAADRQIAEAEAEAKRAEEETEQRLAREIEPLRRRRIETIRKETRTALLSTRGSLTEEVFSRIEAGLRSLPGTPDYPILVRRLAAELLPELPEGELIVWADPDGPENGAAASAVSAVRSLLSERAIEFRPLPDEEIGGLMVADAAETVLIRNTLRGRLRRSRPVLLVEIYRWLSETSSDPTGKEQR